MTAAASFDLARRCAPDDTVGPVLAFATGQESYGVLRGWQGVARQFQRRGQPFTFALVDRDGPLSRAMTEMGVDTVFLDRTTVPRLDRGGVAKLFGLGRRVAAQARLVGPLVRLIRERGIRRLIVTSPLEVFVAGIVARIAGIRAYWMMPNTVSDQYPLDLNRRIFRAVFRHLNTVPLPNSRYTETTLGQGAFDRRVVYLGIDPKAFESGASRPGLSRAALGIPDGAVLIGVFARMVDDKGQAMLAEAVARMGDAAADVHLLFCGGPVDDYARRIADRAAAAGMKDRVHISGPVDAGIAAYYALCDVVASTRLSPEPFGLSVIEGMLMAKPLLVHRAGGPGETVIDGEIGWHIDAPTVAAFETGVGRALRDRDRWQAMGRAARAHALAHFTDERMADRLIDAMRVDSDG